ncbi:MAG: hypothetical protein ACE15D_11955 [Candidatus Eisenbacteria bacterium]
MRLPSRSTSARILLVFYGAYLMVRLGVESLLAEILEFFRPFQERLTSCLEAYDRAVLRAQQALALRDHRDFLLDREILMLYNVLLARVGGDRDAASFRAYFPDGLPAVTRVAAPYELRRVAVLQQKLAEEAIPEIAAYGAPIAAAAQALQEALDGYTQALTAREAASGLLEVEKAKWLDGYAQTFRRLQLHFHDDPKRAEEFFRVRPRKGTPIEEPKATAPEPAQSATATS